jgi:hypothetical protein
VSVAQDAELVFRIVAKERLVDPDELEQAARMKGHRLADAVAYLKARGRVVAETTETSSGDYPFTEVRMPPGSDDSLGPVG